MMKKIIVLIAGKMAHGKNILVNEFMEMGYIRKSFAAPLKNMLNQIIESIDPKLLEIKNKKYIRDGYHWLRKIGKKSNINFWIDKVKEDIDNSTHGFFIIDDCKLSNELNVFDDDKYIVFKIMMNKKTTYIPNFADPKMILDDSCGRKFDFISKGGLKDFDELFNKLARKDFFGKLVHKAGVLC